MKRLRLTLGVLLVFGLPWLAQRPAAAADDPGRTDTVTTLPSFLAGYEGWVSTQGMSDDGRTVLFTPGDPYFAGYGHGRATFVRDMQGGYRAVVTAPDGSAANGGVSSAVLSGDGEVVAFVSNATNLDPSATGTAGGNVYVVRLSSGPIKLVSRLPGASTAANNADPDPLQITPNGRYVLFGARSPRLDDGPAPTTGARQLYRYDVLTGTTTAVSVANDNSLGSADSFDGSMSADGRYVAFISASRDLTTPHATTDGYDVYLRDLTTATTTLVSHALDAPAQRTTTASDPMISADGSTVVFLSYRAAALSGEPAAEFVRHVVAWTQASDTARLVTKSATTGGANAWSSSPRVSADGSVIAFLSGLTDLVPGVTDHNNPPPGPPPPISYVFSDAYAEVNGTMRLLSHAASSPTHTGNQGVDRLLLSRDGRRAAFSAVATDLVIGLGDGGFGADLYTADTATATVRAASLEGRSSTLLTGDNEAVAFTPDGSQLAFTQAYSSGSRVRAVSRRRAFGPTLPPIPPVPGVVGSSPAPTPAPVLFNALTPTRILDSRPAGPKAGPYATPWGAGTTRNVKVAGAGGVPADASAVVVNATATSTSAAGYLTVWPNGQARPIASSVNWAAGQTVPNQVTVKVGAGGEVSVFNAVGTADVIFDVVGYYAAAGAGFTPLQPKRIQDSRPGGPQHGSYSTPWGPAMTRNVTVASPGGVVPLDAAAVVVNATVTNPSGAGYLTIWPVGEAMPLASSLNWAPKETVPNAVTTRLGAGGQISVFNANGTADVIIDVVGYFRAGSGDPFHPVAPVRIQDSRPGGPQVGSHFSPWGPGVERGVQVVDAGGVPEGATAALLNVTATNTSAASYATVWPAFAEMPLASSLNWDARRTRANAVTTKLAAGGVSIRNAAGTVDVIADVAGWYG